MMQDDKIKWNARYKNHPMPQNVSPLLLSFQDILPQSGDALDIACGNGRNLKFLAKKGLNCLGIDISEEALACIPKEQGIQTICEDLDLYELPKKAFDVILNFYFLDLRILRQVVGALREGGLFLLETFIQDDAFITDIAPAKMLKQGELEAIFETFKTIHQEYKVIIREKNHQKAKVVCFVAQKC